MCLLLTTTDQFNLIFRLPRLAPSLVCRLQRVWPPAGLQDGLGEGGLGGSFLFRGEGRVWMAIGQSATPRRESKEGRRGLTQTWLGCCGCCGCCGCGCCVCSSLACEPLPPLGPVVAPPPPWYGACTDKSLYHLHRPSKCPKFNTTIISGETIIAKKSVNFVKMLIATNCYKFNIIH